MQNRIKECRTAKKMTQTELGKRIGTADNAISRYETGIRKPSLITVEKLATALDVNPAYLVGWIDDE